MCLIDIKLELRRSPKLKVSAMAQLSLAWVMNQGGMGRFFYCHSCSLFWLTVNLAPIVGTASLENFADLLHMLSFNCTFQLIPLIRGYVSHVPSMLS